MLSDQDIRNQIEERKNDPDKGISIFPFEDVFLTPVGYDMRVGLKGFSWKNKREI
jgi:dCTP deaminase